MAMSLLTGRKPTDGLYGENTCDSCNDGFGIATDVGNETGNIEFGGGP